MNKEGCLISAIVMTVAALGGCRQAPPDAATLNARQACVPVAEDGRLSVAKDTAASSAVSGSPDKAAAQEFHDAVRTGDLETVRRLVAQDRRLLSCCDPSKGETGGMTPLWVAVDAGNLEMVKLLVESGASAKEESALKRAVILMDNTGRASVIKELSSKRASMSATGKAKSDAPVVRPFANIKAIAEQQKAGADRRLAILAWLLEQGADPSAKPTRESEPLLIYSCYFAFDDRVLALLLKHGANPNARDPYGYTALHVAVLTGNAAAVRALSSVHSDMEAGGAFAETALMLAAAYGDVDMVRTLLDRGARVGSRDKRGWNALRYALKSNREDVFKMLFEKGVSCADLTGPEPPILNIVCMTGTVAMAELCLSRGAALELADSEGYTPLLCALEKGHAEIAKLLLARGADCKARTRTGLTALHLAAATGSLELARTLLAQGAEVDAEEAESRVTPLGEAARNGRLEVAKLLLAKGAAVRSKSCNSPLMNAALGPKGRNQMVAALNEGRPGIVPGTEADYLAVAKLLIGKGADANAKDTHGYSPLSIALSKGFHAMADLLIENGAQLSFERFGEDTLLHIACAGGNKKVAESLLSKGAEVDARGKRGYTPLHYAADCGHPAVVGLLMEHQAALNARTQDGRTALYLAAQGHLGGPAGPPPDADYAAVAEVLIRRGADVRAVMADTGAQPLHVAALVGNIAVARVLLDHGAPLEGQDRMGCTPLHMAAMWRKTDLVKCLLERGANYKARNAEGATTLHFAAVSGSVDLLNIFLDMGLDIDDTGLTCEETPLCMAALYGHSESVNHLLQRGAKVDPDLRVTPLMWAVVGAEKLSKQTAVSGRMAAGPRNGTDDDYLLSAAMLIEAGANVNARTKEGETVLALALNGDNLAAADLLVRNGAEVDTRHNFGRTLLHEACASGVKKRAEFLLARGADIEARDDGGFTPLLSASDRGHPALVELLLKHKAALRAVSKDGRTALDLAAQGWLKNSPAGPHPDSDYAAVAEVLIRCGADVRVANERTGMQPLHTAAWSGNKPVARVLLDNGAPVDALGPAGNTPLSLAVRYSNPAVVELLLVHKANVSHKNNDGLSVLDLARSQKSSDIEEMLRRYGAGGERSLGIESGEPSTDSAPVGQAVQRVDPVAAAERSLQAAENNLAPDHPEVAVCLCRLADAYAAQGQNSLAATMYRRALAIREKALGPDRAQLAEVLEKLAAVYRKTGAWDKEAEELETRAAAVRAVTP